MFAVWREMALTMARSRVLGDRGTAIEIVSFVGAMPVQQSKCMGGRERGAGLEQADQKKRTTDERSNDIGPEVEHWPKTVSRAREVRTADISTRIPCGNQNCNEPLLSERENAARDGLCEACPESVPVLPRRATPVQL